MHRLCQTASRYKLGRIAAFCRHTRRLDVPASYTKSFATCVGLRKDDDFTVRWFEQHSPGLKGIKRVREEDEEQDEDDDELQELKKQITELEKEIDDLGNGSTQQLVSPEDHKEIEEARRQRRGKQVGNFTAAEAADDDSTALAEFDDELEVKYQLPRTLRLRIREFNHALRRAALDVSDQLVMRNLWVSYARCSSSVPNFLHQIPDAAWDILWQSQSRETIYQDPNHVIKLLNDMIDAGRQLTPNQRISYIKARFAEGQGDQALQMWYYHRRELQPNLEVKKEFEDLGVALEAAAGRPQRAQSLAFEVLHGQASERARILLPVIGAWAKRGDDQSIKNAWLLYLYIRKQLGRAITLEDYDGLFLGFLEAGRTDTALVVFKDLVLAGRNSSHDSTELYKTSLSALDRLQSNSLSPTDLNNISLQALTYLPRRLENKWFYGSWMKRLLGMGQAEAAASVLELMYERGVRPDPKHLNGIMGAWLRGGDTKDQEKALQVGWAMVQERLDFVAERRRRRGLGLENSALAVINAARVPIPKHLQRRVPPATIETFCLLLLYYERRHMASYVRHLQEALEKAELRPNSYFMNHLLYSRLHHEGPIAAWKLYTEMTARVPDLKPDLVTYACLWDCAKAAVSRYSQMDMFPGPRRLFSHMSNWFSRLQPAARDSVRDEFPKELYSQIIRCFCTWKDLKGTIVVLYALRDSYQLYPGPDAMRLVTLQIAQMGDRRQAGHAQGRARVRRKVNAGVHNPVTIERVSRALDLLVQQRSAELKDQGIVREELDEQQQGEENLYILTQLLQAADRRAVASHPHNGTNNNTLSEEELEKLAWEMEAGPLRMEAPVYSGEKA